MKFSEAIRLGATAFKPLVGNEIRIKDGLVVAACARQAALLAAGLIDTTGMPTVSTTPTVGAGRDGVERVEYQYGISIDQLPPGWGSVFMRFEKCPVARCERYEEVWQMLAHLNDKHKKTREWVANWVEKIEDQITQFGRAIERDHQHFWYSRSLVDSAKYVGDLVPEEVLK